MTIQVPQVGEIFHVTIHKQLVLYPERTFVNSYSLKVELTATTSDLEDAASTLAAFEQAFLNSTSVINQYKIWQDGTVNQFILGQLNLVGSIDTASSDPLPLENVLLLKKVPSVGRSGVASYRDCLLASETARDNGIIKLTDLTGKKVAIDTAVTTHLTEYFPGGADALRLVKYSNTDGEYQELASLTLKGVSTRDLKNVWFNRSSS